MAPSDLHPNVQQSVTHVPIPTPHTSWQSYIAAYQAPRAELVKLPPPRAQLVSLPEWRVGETRPVMLPCGIEAIAGYRGRLDAEWMLPQSGNQLGGTLLWRYAWGVDLGFGRGSGGLD